MFVYRGEIIWLLGRTVVYRRSDLQDLQSVRSVAIVARRKGDLVSTCSTGGTLGGGSQSLDGLVRPKIERED